MARTTRLRFLFTALVFGPISCAALHVARQTGSNSYTNGSVSTTASTTSTTSSTWGRTQVTPAPSVPGLIPWNNSDINSLCCIVFAPQVLLNTWWPGGFNQTVATAVTTYLQYDNIIIAANSSILTANYSSISQGAYGANIFPTVANLPGIPTNLVPVDDGDYGGTMVGNGTVVTFSSLTIASPTPYWIFADLQITLQTPMTINGQLACTSTSYYTDPFYTEITEPSTTIYSSTGATTFTEIGPQSANEWAGNPGAGTWLNVSNYYVATVSDSVAATWVPANDLEGFSNIPSDIIPWLATQPGIIASYPYIHGCLNGPGAGEPTVHVPVNQLTETSTQIIRMSGCHGDCSSTSSATPAKTTSVPSPTSPGTTTTPVALPDSTSAHSTSPEATSPEATSPETTSPKATSPEATSPQTTSPDTTVPGTANPHSTEPATSQSTNENGPVPTSNNANNPPSPSTQTSADINPILSIVSEVATHTTAEAQSSQGASSAPGFTAPGSSAAPVFSFAPTTTAGFGATSAAPTPSVTGYAIGSQTATPGGAPVTHSGTIYSALSSGSGVQVAANGVTSTIVPAEASPSGASVQTISSGSAYVVSDHTFSPGGSAVVQEGTTYSALPSGSGVVAAANGASTTIASAGSNLITPIALPAAAATTSGYVVGGQTVVVGGTALTEQGTTYSALPSGSGIEVAANGVTSTASGSGSTALTLPGGIVATPIAFSASAVAASITVGPEVMRYAPLGSSAALIGTAVLSVGGPAVTENGETLSLVSGSTGLAVVIDGTTTSALPTGVATKVGQVVTLGSQTFTAYAAGVSGGVIVDGETVYPGTPTVIAGETVQLTGTDLVVASGTATSTEGLGSAIMSGLGSVSAAATGGTSTPEPFTGDGPVSRPDVGIALAVGVGLASLFAIIQ